MSQDRQTREARASGFGRPSVLRRIVPFAGAWWGLCALALAQPAAPSPEPGGSTNPDAETREAFPADAYRMALDPTLDLETRRYMAYLYARVNKPAIAELLAEEILKDNPGDQQTLLVLASMYLEQRSTRKLANVVRRLSEYYPQDDQTLFFQASAHYLANDFKEANAVLKSLKESQFQNRRFPYLTDLASAARQSRDWHRSMLAYQELLRHHALGEELKLESRSILETLYRAHLPRAGLQASHILLKQGWIARGAVEYRRHLNDSALLFLRGAGDEYQLEESPQSRGQRASRSEAELKLQLDYGAPWSFTGYAGVSEAGPFGGGEAARFLGEKRGFKLSLDWQKHAAEGLNFEILDGRQNRLWFQSDYYLEQDWASAVEFGFKQLTLDRETLANGYGGSWGLEKILLRKTPELRIGYRGQWIVYSRETTDLNLVDPVAAPGLSNAGKREMLEGLIRTQNHRHGLYVSMRTGRSGVYDLHGLLGGDYVLDLESPEFYTEWGFSIYPRKSIELTGKVAYSSSADTSDSGSDQWLLSGLLQYYF